MRWTLLGFLLFMGCSKLPVSQVIVSNYSGISLEDVTLLSTAGFSEGVWMLRNGDYTTFKIRTRTPMSLQVKFSTPQGDITKGGLGYIEPSRRSLIHITINEGFKVTGDQTNL